MSNKLEVLLVNDQGDVRRLSVDHLSHMNGLCRAVCGTELKEFSVKELVHIGTTSKRNRSNKRQQTTI